MAAILERNGLNLNGDFEYAHPMEFDMMCNINQTTMQPVTPPFYYIRLWAKMNGLPIMTHAMSSYNKAGWPMYEPDFTLMMMNEESYSILLVTMKEAERVAEDIPLCPLQTVIENLEKEIIAFLKRNGGKVDNLSLVLEQLKKKHPNFNLNDYGYSRISSFLRSFDKITVHGNALMLKETVHKK